MRSRNHTMLYQEMQVFASVYQTPFVALTCIPENLSLTLSYEKIWGVWSIYITIKMVADLPSRTALFPYFLK